MSMCVCNCVCVHLGVGIRIYVSDEGVFICQKMYFVLKTGVKKDLWSSACSYVCICLCLPIVLCLGFKAWNNTLNNEKRL